MNLVNELSPYSEVCLGFATASIGISVVLVATYRSAKSSRESWARVSRGCSGIALTVALLLLAVRITDTLRITSQHDYGAQFILEEVLLFPLALWFAALIAFALGIRAFRRERFPKKPGEQSSDGKPDTVVSCLTSVIQIFNLQPKQRSRIKLPCFEQYRKN